MKKESIKKIFIISMIVYVVLTTLFYFLAGDQLKYKNSKYNITMPEADSVSDELVNGVFIRQDFKARMDRIDSVAIVFTKFYKEMTGDVVIELLDGIRIIAKKEIKIEDIPEQQRVFLNIDKPLYGVKDKTLTIKIYGNAFSGNAPAVMVNQKIENGYTVGYKKYDGTLCFSVNGSDEIWIGTYYWLVMGILGILLGLLLYLSYKQYLNGKTNYIVGAILAIYQYKFLISQLVLRDFKSKYKRSILGVFWSFLNPLLTMTVQFLVFSTFFRADTHNYPVYLLSGVVCFSFFSECTTMCLSSISGNARLITKVYIPKYIFPLARSISSSINLGISLIPLILVCLIMGVPIKPQALLFFYFLLCLIIFSLGVGMFLSALMVFFRDIQFLWTVLIQIWMYATPIFYPAEIIPEQYKFIVRLNPLYHFIGNARTCLLNGISPEPSAYMFCAIFAIGALLIGAVVFKKTQDKFALYL